MDSVLLKISVVHQHPLIVILIATLCLGMAGCHGSRKPNLPDSGLFWPNQPEVKRIRFLHAVSTPADLNIGAGMIKQVVNYIIGSPAPRIVSPHGVSSDDQGRLYVVDTFQKQVHVFDADQNNYFAFPADGKRLAAPVGIDVDSKGLIYVTDAKDGVVKIFKDRGRQYVSELGRGDFQRPTGIAVNAKTSELLVVDTLQSQVFRYDLASHVKKGGFGGKGRAAGRFHYPTQICVTSAGNIIVSDSLNFRVQVFSPDGRFLNTFGQMGHGPGTFSRPKGVASDSAGNIYVVDALFDNVQMFDASGRLLMAFGDHGGGYGEFWLPNGIHIDKNDRVYVSDSSNQRVQVFKYIKEDIANEDK